MMLLVLRNIMIITSGFKVDFQKKKGQVYKISESWNEFAKSVIRIIRLMRWLLVKCTTSKLLLLRVLIFSPERCLF